MRERIWKRKEDWKTFFCVMVILEVICILVFGFILGTQLTNPPSSQNFGLIIGSFLGLFAPLIIIALGLCYLLWSAIFHWREVNVLKTITLINQLEKEEDNIKKEKEKNGISREQKQD